MREGNRKKGINICDKRRKFSNINEDRVRKKRFGEREDREGSVREMRLGERRK